MYGINSFYYTKIAKFKKNIRNNLLFFLNSNDEHITTTIQDLVALFLIDQDNLKKELFNEKEMELVKPIITAFFNDEDIVKKLNKKEAKVFVDLALNKRLSLEYNEELAVRFAEIYNQNCQNELLRINIDTFRKICKEIDN